MGWERGRAVGRELIDFASSPPSRGLEFNARLSVGAVTLTHCTSRPIEGRHLGAAQITVAIHDGATFDMDWRGGESDRLRSSTVSHGRGLERRPLPTLGFDDGLALAPQAAPPCPALTAPAAPAARRRAQCCASLTPAIHYMPSTMSSKF